MMRIMCRIGMVVVLFKALCGSRAEADLTLNPYDYTSLGALQTTPGEILTLGYGFYGVSLTGNGVNVTGVFNNGVVAFDFDSINLNNTTITSINYNGAAPVAFLSRGDAFVSGQISVNGSIGVTYPQSGAPGGPGGGSGGSEVLAPGGGPGGGGGGGFTGPVGGAGGGGFGGNGGNGGAYFFLSGGQLYGAQGGLAYGDLSQTLRGGSGGGGPSGGGGGGGIAIIANGSLTLCTLPETVSGE